VKCRKFIFLVLMAWRLEGKCPYHRGTCCLHPMFSPLSLRQQVPADQYFYQATVSQTRRH